MEKIDPGLAAASKASDTTASNTSHDSSRPPLERAALEDFERIGPEGWRARVEEELGSRPFESLVAKTLDGIRIEPLYTGETEVAPAMPGLPPYRRGRRLAGGARPWRIVQEVAEPRSPGDELERGVDGLWLCFDRSLRSACPVSERDGLAPHDAAELGEQLADGAPGVVWTMIDAGAGAPVAAALYLAAARQRDIPWEQLEGCWGYDPLAALARDGQLPTLLEVQWDLMADLAAWSARETPGMRSILVSSRPHHDAGAPPVDEVAYALATGIEYLRRLTAAGLSSEAVARQMVFSVSVGRDLFVELAKLRALRLLWAKVVEQTGAAPRAAAMFLHARTSAATLTIREPWLNLLRVAAEGFAAVVAGVEALTLSPYDEALGTGREETRRHALQAHHLLAEEAHLGRVADPAGGSWAIESLTDQLARAAWQKVRAIEQAGGMAAHLLSGALAEELEHRAHQRRERLARRADAIVGVSEFPQLDSEPGAPDLETVATEARGPGDAIEDDGFPPPLAAARLEELAALLEGEPGPPGERTAALIEAAAAGASSADLGERLRAAHPAASLPTVEPLPLRRWAAPFEDLRSACERWRSSHGRPPRVVLANLGSLAEFGPRADFATNFFAAGGIETVRGGGGESIATIANEAITHLASGAADGVVLCGTDPRYREMAVELASALHEKGARWIFLAGRPGEEETDYRDAGIDTFIFLGCDVLAVLEAFLGDLEVIR